MKQLALLIFQFGRFREYFLDDPGYECDLEGFPFLDLDALDDPKSAGFVKRIHESMKSVNIIIREGNILTNQQWIRF